MSIINQTYYPIPLLTYKDKYLLYEIEDLYYSYDINDENLSINYILNIPIKYLSNHIKIKCYYLKSEIKIFYSIYDDYLSKYLKNDEIKNLKQTNISYISSDIKYFPKYLSATPFTPVKREKFVFGNEKFDLSILSELIFELLIRKKIPSFHINFIEKNV